MEALRFCADCWACSQQQFNKNAPNICFMHHFHLSARLDLMEAGFSPVHVLYTHILPRRLNMCQMLVFKSFSYYRGVIRWIILHTLWKHTFKMGRMIIAFIIWYRWCEDLKYFLWSLFILKLQVRSAWISKSDPGSNFMLLKHTLLTLTSFSVILLFAPLGFYSRFVPPCFSQSVPAPNRS